MEQGKRAVYYTEDWVDHKLVMEEAHWAMVVQAKVKGSVEDLTIEVNGSSFSIDIANISLIH